MERKGINPMKNTVHPSSMHSLRLAGAGAASLLIMLAGCGAQSQAAGPVRPTVIIGYQNGSDPQTVAIEQKFFQKMIHAPVELKYFSSGPAALTSLASGSLQFMTGMGSPPVVAAINKGVPLKIVWVQDRYVTAEGLVVKDSANITGLSQLSGRTVALVDGSSSPWQLDTALQTHHIPVSAVHIDDTAPANMVAAWKTGQIDAAYVWSPFLNDMQADGGHILIYDQNQVNSAPMFTYAVVNASFASKYPKLVEDFVKAEAQGVTYYDSHPSQSYQDMATLNGISAAAAKTQAAELRFTPLSEEVTSRRMGTAATVSSSLVATSLHSAANWLKATGQITAVPPHLDSYIAPQFCQDALGSHAKT